jgi:ATP-dependent protease ClpP protease subunit
MFHPASLSGQFQGELDKLFSRLGFLKSNVDKMDNYIAQRANMTAERFKSLTTRELWLDSEDAVDNNFLDKIVALENLPKRKVEENLFTFPNKFRQDIKLDN